MNITNTDGDSFELNFGAYCILESMAHIGQNFFFNVPHNDVPYHCAELVAKNVYNIIGNNLLYVFALCDASLMTYQPGLIFLRALETMKQNKFIPQNEYEVYDYVFKNFKAETVNLMSHFSWLSGFSNLQILGYFTTPAFANEKQWINLLLKNAHDYRVSNPYFLIDIVKSASPKSQLFIDVFKKLGTPLMFNDDGGAWFYPPDSCKNFQIKPDRLSAILEIFELFEYGKLKCDLIEFCGLDEDADIVDERCDMPWTRCRDENLCGYGAQWRTWGLSKYSPIRE